MYLIIELQNMLTETDRTAKRIDKSTIMARDFNTPHTVINRAS